MQGAYSFIRSIGKKELGGSGPLLERKQPLGNLVNRLNTLKQEGCRVPEPLEESTLNTIR